MVSLGLPWTDTYQGNLVAVSRHKTVSVNHEGDGLPLMFLTRTRVTRHSLNQGVTVSGYIGYLRDEGLLFPKVETGFV
jgi:hypothetical protein